MQRVLLSVLLDMTLGLLVDFAVMALVCALAADGTVLYERVVSSAVRSNAQAAATAATAAEL